MGAQGNSYKSQNINLNKTRYVNQEDNRRLGDRTLTSQTTDGKRYFSSLDAEIYFGERYIDEVVQITWGVEQATMPLFGYNSYTFDDIAIGARQISGSFVINFTKSGFMYDVLRNIQAINRSSFDTKNTSGLDGAKLSWESHFDKEHSASWDRSFNIRVGYGDQNTSSNNTTMIVLHCAQITGCQQVIGIDGAPIAEVYTFIAKDIRYELTGLPEVTPSTEKEESPKADNTIPKDDFVIEISPKSLTLNDNLPDGAFGPPSAFHYTIVVDHTFGGGTVKDILLTLRSDSGENITPAALQLGSEKSITFDIPLEYTTQINRNIEKQKSLGANNEHTYLLCDFKIVYEKDGKSKMPIFKNNQKVYLKK